MFGITGTGLAVVKGMQNGGKKPRFGLDQWDKVRGLWLPFGPADHPRFPMDANNSLAK